MKLKKGNPQTFFDFLLKGKFCPGTCIVITSFYQGLSSQATTCSLSGLLNDFILSPQQRFTCVKGIAANVSDNQALICFVKVGVPVLICNKQHDFIDGDTVD